MSTNGKPNGPAIRPGHSDEEILRIARQANQSIFWRTVSVLSIFLLGVVGVLAANASRDAQHASDRVAALALQNRTNAITFCETAKRPPTGFLFVLANDKLTQARQTHELGVPNLAEKFGISVKTLKQSLAQQRAVADSLLNLDCIKANPVP